jgi:hypothetical protein
MAGRNKAHIIFDEDVSTFLQDFTSRAKFPSVTYSAHYLLRLIETAEINTEVILKDSPETEEKKSAPVHLRKKLRMQMKI